MITVTDVNNTFAQKGVHIKLPLPGHFLVKNIKILEKRKHSGGVELLLNIQYIDESGKEISDLFFCGGKLDIKVEKKVEEIKPPLPLKSDLLPLRENSNFENDEEASAYLQTAISHFLKDKGFQPGEQSDADLYFQKEERGFFINLTARCDEMGMERAKELIELRRKHGSQHEYGLIIPAFQDSLGISLSAQERWVWRNQEHLSAHHIGVYAIDNINPNRIYAFTIYPKVRELRVYFITTAQQWSLVRDRYVMSRSHESTKEP